MFSSPALRSLVLLLLALALATPVLVVAGSWLAGASPNWGHLSSTVLPSYLRHSLFLALFTGTGTLLIGVAAAWAVSRFRFPGRRVLEWALLLPLACPAYLIAYTWTGMLASEGALQQALPLPLPDIRSPAGAGNFDGRQAGLLSPSAVRHSSSSSLWLRCLGQPAQRGSAQPLRGMAYARLP